MARLMGAERRGLLLYLVLLGVTVGILGSCATEQRPPPQTSAVRPLPPPAPENVVRPRPVPRPARKPAPPAPVEGPASPTGASLVLPPPTSLLTPGAATTPASIPPVEAGPPPPEASELIGLDQPAATRLFGPAAERSEEPPATVWRYKTASCELDLFFYLDLSSGRMRTLHYALKGGGADTTRRRDCLRSLVASRGG